MRVMEKYAKRVLTEVPDVKLYLKGKRFEETEFFARIQNFRKRECQGDSAEAQVGRKKALEYTLGGFTLWANFKLMEEGINKDG